MYEYRARVVDVYDGDSIKAIVDLGFGLHFGNEALPRAFRIKGIDTPEMKLEQREAGTVVRDWLRSLIDGKHVTLRTYKPDKYGRWLCDVLVDVGEVAAALDVAKAMIDLGYAKPYNGGHKDPWTAEQLADIIASVTPDTDELLRE